MRTIFLISVFVVQSFSLWAVQDEQQITNYTREDCQKLIDEADEQLGNNKFADALEKLLEAERIAEQHQWNDKLWYVKNQIGMIYYYISGFGDALSYYQESLAIIEKDKTLNEKATYTLNRIGILYGQEGKNKEALKYYEKAYEIVKNQSGSWRKQLASNIAEAYINTDEIEKGLELLNKVKNDTGTRVSDFLWNAIYIKALIANNKISEAQKITEPFYAELISDSKKGNLGHCFVCIAALLSEIYEKSNKIDKAMIPANQALFHTDKFSDHVELYNIISRLYLQKGEYKTALLYKDSAFVAKDSLIASINRSQYEMNKVKFKTQEYQNELKTEKERKRAQQKIFFGSAILSFVLFFSLYRGLRNRIVKQKQKVIISSLELEKEKKEHQLAEKQKLLVENELETNKLKQQQLDYQVAEKNRKLTAKALYFTKRNKLIQDIIYTIEVNSNKTDNKEIAKQIRAIKNILKADDQQENFMNHFESVNPNFFKRLKEKHPQLTANDIRFLCYVFMNLNLKEISSVFNITYNAAEIRKRRIQKKIGLNKEASLFDYMISIVD